MSSNYFVKVNDFLIIYILSCVKISAKMDVLYFLRVNLYSTKRVILIHPQSESSSLIFASYITTQNKNEIKHIFLFVVSFPRSSRWQKTSITSKKLQTSLKFWSVTKSIHTWKERKKDNRNLQFIFKYNFKIWAD